MSLGDPITVSVIVPCYNSAVFLPETVESVLAQSLGALELIFVDDGSSDDTRAVIARLLAKHHSTRMSLLSQSNAGVASARNRGISIARGRYILPLDADDLIAPTMLEACAAILDRQPHTALVFTDRQDFGALSGTFAAGRFDLSRLKYFNQLSSCAMFRREMWQAIGGYRVNVSGFDDWDFWLAAASRGFGGHHLPQPLFHHRRRRDSQLAKLMSDYERLHANIILNNREVYGEAEIAAADDYLSRGEPAALLLVCKRIFAHHYPVPGAAGAR